jgi:hypothetical protein
MEGTVFHARKLLLDGCNAQAIPLQQNVQQLISLMLATVLFALSSTLLYSLALLEALLYLALILII